MSFLTSWYGSRMTEWGETGWRSAPTTAWSVPLTGVSTGRTAGRSPSGCPRNGHDPEAYLRLLNREALANSDDFFAYETPRDFRLDGDMLRFTSAVETPYPEKQSGEGEVGFQPKSRPSEPWWCCRIGTPASDNTPRCARGSPGWEFRRCA